MCHFGGNFGFDPKSGLFELNFLEYLRAEHLVARFHVGQIDLGEDIGKRGEQPVGNAVPEIQYA